VAVPTGWQQPFEPAGPAPGVAFAGHGARLGAYILDAIILGLVVSAILVLSTLPVIGTILGRVGGQPDYWSDSTSSRSSAAGSARHPRRHRGVAAVGMTCSPGPA